MTKQASALSKTPSLSRGHNFLSKFAGGWALAGIGLLAMAGGGGCASRQTGNLAGARSCPVVLRNAHVQAEQRPQDVLVRVTGATGEDASAIAANAELIADALSRHPQVPASQDVGSGREVRISRLNDGVELAFSSSGVVGMEVLRRRIDDRVVRWQSGECPSVDQTQQNVNQARLLEAAPPAGVVVSLQAD